MPPSVGKKTNKNDAARQQQILSAKEKVLKIKKSILKIVEDMLEEDITKDWFLANCTKLCQADYDDVTQERSIDHLCGYPLCSKPIKQVMKQQYHISRITNKVYDLTERKCFCSNECYKASNYLKAQLSPIPLYMRKEESLSVNLLSDCENRGSAGEEVIFHHIIHESEIEKMYNHEPEPNNLSNILQEEVKKCADALGDLKIKENVYKNSYTFQDQMNEPTTKVPAEVEKNVTSSSSDFDSDDSDDDKKLFPDYDNVSVLSHKQMPVPEKTKKAVLISPLTAAVTKKSLPEVLSLQFAHHIFEDWMTEDTLKYLLGERQVYAAKADLLFKTMMSSDPNSSDKLHAIKDEYINLCIKLDKLPEDLSDSGEIDIQDDVLTLSESKPVSKVIELVNETTTKISEKSSKNLKRRPKRKSKGKNKLVSFASAEIGKKDKPKVEFESFSKKIQNSQESPSNEPLAEPAFPLVDSVSQNALRRQVLSSKLKSVFLDILPAAGLHYMDIRHGIKGIVSTFSLTPTNIMFKPKELKLIAVVLLRMLTKTILKNLHEEDKFLKLCESGIIPTNITIQMIEDLVSELINLQQLQRLQGCHDAQNKC